MADHAFNGIMPVNDVQNVSKWAWMCQTGSNGWTNYKVNYSATHQSFLFTQQLKWTDDPKKPPKKQGDY